MDITCVFNVEVFMKGWPLNLVMPRIRFVAGYKCLLHECFKEDPFPKNVYIYKQSILYSYIIFIKLHI